MKEIRPVRIRLWERTQEEVIADINMCFPSVDDLLLDRFYEQVSPLYREVLLDAMSGELLMGLTHNAGWIVFNYYLRNIPLPETLADYSAAIEANREDEENGGSNGSGNNSKAPEPININSDTINRIIDKIAEHGEASLSSRDKKYMTQLSKQLRDDK